MNATHISLFTLRLRRGLERRVKCIWLSICNQVDHRPVTGDPSQPVVSLTTYGSRANTVHLTIESIAQGQVKASRLILWLDNSELVDKPNPHLSRLQRRGLEIYLTENFGPHKKYFPYVISESDYDVPLVTADDDVIYPPDWLAELTMAHRRRPDDIHCFRAHTIGFSGSKLLPYQEWRSCYSTEPSRLTFATGVSGVIYPTQMLVSLRRHGRGFIDNTLLADDVWLHWVALRSNIQVCQIRDSPTDFCSLPATQRVTLTQDNLDLGRNDQFITNTYSDNDLSLLLAELPARGKEGEASTAK